MALARVLLCKNISKRAGKVSSLLSTLSSHKDTRSCVVFMTSSHRVMDGEHIGDMGLDGLLVHDSEAKTKSYINTKK